MRRARPCASRPEQPFCHFLPFSIYAVFLFWLHVSIFCSSASFLFPIPPLLLFFPCYLLLLLLLRLLLLFFFILFIFWDRCRLTPVEQHHL